MSSVGSRPYGYLVKVLAARGLGVRHLPADMNLAPDHPKVRCSVRNVPLVAAAGEASSAPRSRSATAAGRGRGQGERNLKSGAQQLERLLAGAINNQERARSTNGPNSEEYRTAALQVTQYELHLRDLDEGADAGVANGGPVQARSALGDREDPNPVWGDGNSFRMAADDGVVKIAVDPSPDTPGGLGECWIDASSYEGCGPTWFQLYGNDAVRGSAVLVEILSPEAEARSLSDDGDYGDDGDYSDYGNGGDVLAGDDDVHGESIGPPDMLIVDVLKADGLMAGDKDGFSTPYAIITLKIENANEEGKKGKKGKKAVQYKFKTKHKDKTVNPRWGERFLLPLAYLGGGFGEGVTATLQVEIWDYDFSLLDMIDDQLGGFEVNDSPFIHPVYTPALPPLHLASTPVIHV